MKETIDKIIEHTARSEGFVEHVYKCPAGYDTIGYGRNIEANPLSTEEKAKLVNGKVSKEVAKEWLRSELERCYKQLDSNFEWFKSLDTARKGALCDMVYNLGFRGFCTFKNTIKAIEARNWNKVAEGLENSKWYRQVGVRSRKIVEIIKSGEIK